MIKITNGKYDENYFNSMIQFELKKYFKSFSSYEDFIKKEKIPFIKKDYFDNWYYTFHSLDIDVDTLQQSTFHKIMKNLIKIDGINYKYENVKELIKNYQRYRTEEYNRICTEFKILAIEYNNS